jgi:hypothetical protein
MAKVEVLSSVGFLVIVHNFDLFGLALIPNEANSPLVVDTDAVLSSTVAM